MAAPDLGDSTKWRVKLFSRVHALTPAVAVVVEASLFATSIRDNSERLSLPLGVAVVITSTWQ